MKRPITEPIMDFAASIERFASQQRGRIPHFASIPRRLVGRQRRGRPSHNILLSIPVRLGPGRLQDHLRRARLPANLAPPAPSSVPARPMPSSWPSHVIAWSEATVHSLVIVGAWSASEPSLRKRRWSHASAPGHHLSNFRMAPRLPTAGGPL